MDYNVDILKLFFSDGQNKGIGKIIGEAVENAFQMSDTNKEISIRLLGISNLNDTYQFISPVEFN